MIDAAGSPSTARDRAAKTTPPRFGAAVRAEYASEGNPQRDGMFVRVVRIPRGRMNAGVWWEITDGNGAFWRQRPANVSVLGPGPLAEVEQLREDRAMYERWAALSPVRVVECSCGLHHSVRIADHEIEEAVPAGGSAPAEAAVRRVVETIDFADSSYDYVCADVDTDVIRLAILNRKDIEVTTAVLRDEIRAFVASLPGGSAPAAEQEEPVTTCPLCARTVRLVLDVHGHLGPDVEAEDEVICDASHWRLSWAAERAADPGAKPWITVPPESAGGSAPHQGATTGGES